MGADARAALPGCASAMARGSAALCAAVVLVASASVRAGFVVETGQLSVETPAGYGPYDMSVANFGRTIYGGQLRCVARAALLLAAWRLRARDDPR